MILFLSVSSAIIFPLPSFLAMELKEAYPSLTAQYTAIWMSAGMRRALRIAHLVPTEQVQLRNAQRVTPKQWLFIIHGPSTKQAFKLCLLLSTLRSCGQCCPPPQGPETLTWADSGLENQWYPRKVSFIPAWVKCKDQQLPFLASGEPSLPFPRTCFCSCIGENKRALLKAVVWYRHGWR